jgi:MerR family mercuric resistance operon transcriptional regulator
MSISDLVLTIGGLAKAADVNVETIRFYQRKGLMPEPDRPTGGIRRYGEQELSRVGFIKSAQRLGFSLDEIGDLLKLEDGSSCAQARQKAQAKLADVRAKLADLHRMEDALASLIKLCGAAKGKVRCPLIAALKREPAI